MILNNATDSPANWSVSNSTNTVAGTKGPESWGTITPPPGDFNYTVTFDGPHGKATVGNVNNPDACVTYVGSAILVTYPGA